MTQDESIKSLLSFVTSQLSKPGTLANHRALVESGESKASTPEEIFTKDFLCPEIAKYFEGRGEKLGLTASEIQHCLGSEGHGTTPGFGFTPASDDHFFTKDQFVKKTPPDSWLESSRLSKNRAYPDFAIRAPLLPCSLVGEVKLIRSGSKNSALACIHEAARQSLFYLAAFKGEYSAAVALIADASDGSLLHDAVDVINPEILGRFGEKSSVYLCCVNLR